MNHWIIHCLLQILLTPILPTNASNASVTPATTTCECPHLFFTYYVTTLICVLLVLLYIRVMSFVMLILYLDYNASNPNSNLPTGLFVLLRNAQATSSLATSLPIQIPAIAQSVPILVIHSAISQQNL